GRRREGRLLGRGSRLGLGRGLRGRGGPRIAGARYTGGGAAHRGLSAGVGGVGLRAGGAGGGHGGGGPVVGRGMSIRVGEPGLERRLLCRGTVRRGWGGGGAGRAFSAPPGPGGGGR